MPRITTTKADLLVAALEQFAERGYDGVGIRDLAAAVGIKESSVYKHFAGKQDLFDSLVGELDARLAKRAAELGINVADATAASGDYVEISEAELVAIGTALLTFFLADPFMVQARRLLVTERFRQPRAAAVWHQWFVDGPLEFQRQIFGELIDRGGFRPADPTALALAFFGPIHLLIDRFGHDDADLTAAHDLLRRHIHEFRRSHLAQPAAN